jgi:hypothetical protein
VPRQECLRYCIISVARDAHVLRLRRGWDAPFAAELGRGRRASRVRQCNRSGGRYRLRLLARSAITVCRRGRLRYSFPRCFPSTFFVARLDLSGLALLRDGCPDQVCYCIEVGGFDLFHF